MSNDNGAASLEPQTLEELQAALAKALTEKENYKGMATKWKSKAKTLLEHDEAEQEDKPVAQANEITPPTLEQQLAESKKRELELKAALASKSSPQVAGGSPQAVETPTSSHWTPEQLSYFKSRNIDPDIVYKEWKATQG